MAIIIVRSHPDNWQQLVLDWFVPGEPEWGDLARYIAAHEPQLGVAWAREILRLGVFFRAGDHPEALRALEQRWNATPHRPHLRGAPF